MSPKTSEHKRTNRLIDETSPYLLQHADNPVDWYPWGEEALAAAKELDRPIFLSIGYSTCHWCHVMAHESFESERIADILNEHFVAIKVDREQRPDVDDVYMNAVQMMTGSGGWPLSIFLTPDAKPFYGGTYYPPDDRMGRPGFARILRAIADAWKNRREELLKSAGEMTRALAGLDDSQDPQPLSAEVFSKAEKYFERAFDSVHGGFSEAPKFPQAGNLSFLMTRYGRTGNRKTLQMVTTTLDAMAGGGIHDHLGGGFHRYSVDASWLVPHFEKMLYDQALLTRAYLEAFQITGRDAYAQVARRTMDYVLGEMTDAAGGFYSAEDADSEGREGTFYLWTPDEITRLLPAEQAKPFMDFYGVTEGGNCEEGKTILSMKMSLEEVAEKHGLTAAGTEELLHSARQTLLQVRSKRPRPHRDEKVIAGWNGLMIGALAMGGRTLADDRYTHAAERSAQFVLSTLRTKGRLRRLYAKGQPVGLAFLDDYAFMIKALLDLYEADFDPKWLAEARSLAEAMLDLFDDGEGGFYLTGQDAEALVVRTKSAYDGAVPGGNSIAAEVLLRLSQITTEDRLGEAGEKTLKAFSGRLTAFPAALTDMLVALDYYFGPRREIVIAGDPNAEETSEMLRLIGRTYVPATIRLFHPEGPAAAEIERIAPFLENQKAVEGRPAAYLCENYACRRPIIGLAELKQTLKSVEEPLKETKNAGDSAVDQ
ncbi:MAG: thioredoxin domain-containing protein [Phycisphaerae bacterium]|nr:thioredoxin domain-containing protein [Phycisphaerae bacterium]